MASYEQAKSLLRHSVARPTLYSLNLTGGNLGKLTAEERKYIKLFCNTVEFPGIDYEQITTIGQEAMGIQRTVPAGLMFGGGNRLRFSVIENSDFGVYNSLRFLFNQACAQGGNPQKNARAQRMNYYNDFKFDVTLTKLEFPDTEMSIVEGGGNLLDHAYKVVATYTFENCYLTEIGPVTYDSNEINTYMTFTSTIHFENYHHDNTIYRNDERAYD